MNARWRRNRLTMREMRITGWPLRVVILLQALFAACAVSVLAYRAAGRAPNLIHFGWLSYRAWNIYLSLLLVAYFVVALRRALPYTVPLLAAFSVFHLVDGVLIGFWTKAVLHALTLLILGWTVLPPSRWTPTPATTGGPDA